MEYAVREGSALPEFVRDVVQADIQRYAEASGDFNPIHIDPAFAATTPLKGTIAHGMLVLAYLSEMLVRAFGEAWDSTGGLSLRFRNPARPGDRLTVSGRVESAKRDGGIVCVTCSVSCSNQAGEVVVSGDAHVALPAPL
ncbi:MAG: MaoC family dehydratase [Dehalococcoidia bacterium]|jgi:3-hydroxybutyryl-CoA dehydratase|nr:MaoC family dehydratase [Dehalococcoidia bacterium]